MNVRAFIAAVLLVATVAGDYSNIPRARLSYQATRHTMTSHTSQDTHRHTSHHDTEADHPPRPYAFSWNVQDAASRNDYGHHEESDGKIVAGSYRVLLPDGRTQTVTYTVRGDEGYVAHVVYSGGAH